MSFTASQLITQLRRHRYDLRRSMTSISRW